MVHNRSRHFLFLQGPHGPYFSRLADALAEGGDLVSAIGFNRGDEAFWRDRKTYTGFRGSQAHWRANFRAYIRRHKITDVVLYGDTKPLHRIARIESEKERLRIHCFEEGYLRPYWVTYERGGTNGNSILMSLPRAVYAGADAQESAAVSTPTSWGALWHHTWYGCMYHANILFRNRAYPHYETHRSVSVRREWMLHCKRLALMPTRMAVRRVLMARLLARARPFHVFMLQLPHDASVTDHGFDLSWSALLDQVIGGFAKGAPAHHLLVFKSHPLDDEREPLRAEIAKLAVKHDVKARVMFIPPGRLGALLDRATSALTINSTAGQQALFRGLPLKTYGRAIYGRPELVSEQPTEEFFAAPHAPDRTAYSQFRAYLLATSQVRGDYYTRKGRAEAVRNVTDLMRAEAGPYETVNEGSGARATTPLAFTP